MPLFYAYFACKLLGCRLICTEHSIWDIQPKGILKKWVTKIIYNTIDAVVGVSSEVTEMFRERFNVKKRKAHTIVNGIDTSRFKPRSKDFKLMSSIGVNKDNIIIGMTANFRRVKNHILLIRAFKIIQKKFPESRLLLIGQGFEGDPENCKREIEELVKKTGLCEKVIFLGYRKDVQCLLPILDIFCLSSFHEGLPLSLIEAMACQIPVIGTNVSGIRTVIKNGINGYLVNTNDHLEFANCLNKLLSDSSLRTKMGKLSRKVVEDFYSLERFSTRYSRLFNSFFIRNKKSSYC
jgi:glycosyltransferase involved in cell wall biosynthesis